MKINSCWLQIQIWWYCKPLSYWVVNVWKTLAFAVGNTNIYGVIFYQMNLLPQLTIPLFSFILKYWCCVILLMLYLDAQSTNHIYQDMQNYVVIVIINIYWDKTSEKLIHDSISIILWRNMCMMYIREEVVPNPLFHSSRKLLVILIIYSNMDFVDTREVSLIGP